VNTAVKAATSAGAVVGQLGFGWLADVIGRRKMYGVELAIIILATLAQSLAAPGQAVTMTGLLLFWRVVMGIGIGGDYPLSAVITSECVILSLLGGMFWNPSTPSTQCSRNFEPLSPFLYKVYVNRAPTDII
jgi:MFS family permease